jgi:5'-nucleotidase
MMLMGKPLEDSAQVRVAISSFLASGGDGFTVFTEGRDTTGGDLDLDVLEAYVKAQSPVSPPPTSRIQRVQ